MISLHTLRDDKGFTICQQLTIPTHIEFEAFKLLIARALNTYVDAHPCLKEFGDILEYGKPLQDYYSQRTDKQIKTEPVSTSLTQRQF